MIPNTNFEFKKILVLKLSECVVLILQAFKKFNEGTVFDMVDPLMNEVVDEEILQKMFGLAIQCAAPIRNDRPDMKLAGERLWAIRADYLKSAKKG